MFSRIARFTVLVVALATSCAAMAASAGAVTWTNSGSAVFTATGGSTTLTTSFGVLSCAGAVTTVNWSSGSTSPVWAPAATGTSTRTGCTIAGSPVSVTSTWSQNAHSWVSGAPAVTTGVRIESTSVTFGSIERCRIDRTVNYQYSNPTLSAAGELVTPIGSGNSAVVTNGAGGPCPLGNNVSAQETTVTFTVTSPAGGGAFITRTP